MQSSSPAVQGIQLDGRPFYPRSFSRLDPTGQSAKYALQSDFGSGVPRIEGEIPVSVKSNDGRSLDLVFKINAANTGLMRKPSVKIDLVAPDNSIDASLNMQSSALRKALGFPCDKDRFFATLGILTPIKDIDKASKPFDDLCAAIEGILEGLGKKRQRLPKKVDISQAVRHAAGQGATKEVGKAMGTHRVASARPIDNPMRATIQSAREMAQAYQKAIEADPTLKKSVVGLMKQMQREGGRRSKLDRKMSEYGHGPTGMMQTANDAEKLWQKRSGRRGVVGRMKPYDQDQVQEVLTALRKRTDDFQRALTALGVEIERPEQEQKTRAR